MARRASVVLVTPAVPLLAAEHPGETYALQPRRGFLQLCLCLSNKTNKNFFFLNHVIDEGNMENAAVCHMQFEMENFQVCCELYIFI